MGKQKLMKILIAEDDLTSQTILEESLKKWNYDPIVVSDGLSAWEILQLPDAPRLIILDWVMPEMDGIEVVRKVRSLESTEPPYIIMVTAKGTKVDIITGLDAGADDYLSKPFDPSELQARVNVGKRILNMQECLAEQIRELRATAKQVKTLHGILPICALCKKIRDDRGYWNQVEEYICNHSEAEFSHSFCPECMNNLYPEFAKKIALLEEEHPTDIE